MQRPNGRRELGYRMWSGKGQTRADPLIHAQESCLYYKNKGNPRKDFKNGVT